MRCRDMLSLIRKPNAGFAIEVERSSAATFFHEGPNAACCGHAGRKRVMSEVEFVRLETSGARLTRRFVIER